LARATLRDAVHRRRAKELQREIEIAEATGSLYDVELANARRALDLQRKEDARNLIAEAKLSHEVERIQAAIVAAEAAGLPAAELDAAQRAMEEEARRDAAREALQLVALGATIAEFQAALQEGEAAGLTEEELSVARTALAEEERGMAAREALRDAVRSRCMEQLRAALEQGADAGLQGYELFDAERVLAEEERKVFVKAQLKDAILKKVRPYAEQVHMLRDAIEEACDIGLDIMDIERAKWHLEFEERQLEARQVLERAMKAQRMEDLTVAIKEAQEAGMEFDELAEAREMLAESYKPAARERLKDAIAAGNVEQLKEAIAYGEAMGISDIGLKAARTALVDEIRREEARKRIFQLVGDGSQPFSLPAHPGVEPAEGGYTIAELRTAVAFGEGSGLPDHELQHSRGILYSEERKIRARARLREAQAVSDIAIIEAAIAESEEAALDEAEAQGAKELRDELIRANKHQSLAEAIKHRKIGPLRAAIADAVDAGVSEEDLAEGRAVLTAEERKVAARAGIEAAMSAELVLESLRAAAREGEESGLTLGELKPIREAVAKEETKAECRLAIQAAVADLEGTPALDLATSIEARPKLVGALRTALRRGRAAKVEAETLERPTRLLEVEEARAEVRTALAAAIATGTDAEVQYASLRARQTLSPEEWEVTSPACAERVLAAASAALAAAVEARDARALPRLLAEAERASAEMAVLEHARVVLATELLRCALAKPSSSHVLRAAIAYAERVLPQAEALPEARVALAREERRDAARSKLREAEKRLDQMAELAQVLRDCREDGLEEWELHVATKLLREHSIRHIAY